MTSGKELKNYATHSEATISNYNQKIDKIPLFKTSKSAHAIYEYGKSAHRNFVTPPTHHLITIRNYPCHEAGDKNIQIQTVFHTNIWINLIFQRTL